VNLFMTKVQKLNRLLPLVAIGTIADCQSIIEPTNRLLVKAGLRLLSTNSHGIVGLSELMIKTGLYAKLQQGYILSSQDIAFTLSPILNSSGRMSHAYLSIASLLSTQEHAKLPFLHPQHQVEGTCSEFAVDLIQTNQDRKAEVKAIVGEVEDKAKAQVESGSKLIWLEEAGLSKGIIGLIASRIVSSYKLPTIVIAVKPILEKDEKDLILELVEGT
jgi:single-stranded-DNA-specific exonuclease